MDKVSGKRKKYGSSSGDLSKRREVDTARGWDLNSFQPDLTSFEADLTSSQPDVAAYQLDVAASQPDVAASKPVLAAFQAGVDASHSDDDSSVLSFLLSAEAACARTEKQEELARISYLVSSIDKPGAYNLLLEKHLLQKHCLELDVLLMNRQLRSLRSDDPQNEVAIIKLEADLAVKTCELSREARLYDILFFSSSNEDLKWFSTCPHDDFNPSPIGNR